MVRHLKIRFLGADDPKPRATLTLHNTIPDDLMTDIANWATGKTERFLGRKRKIVTINVVKG